MAKQGSGKARKRRPAGQAGRVEVCPREHRQKAGISLDAIAESTKICRRHLEAIEEGQFKLLPGGVFATSYIRQYAAATGYDADVILASYRLSLKPESDDRPEESRAAAANAPARWTKFFSIG